MSQPNLEANEKLKIYYFMLLLAAVINPIWGWITPIYLVEGAKDGILTRILGSSVAYLGLVLLRFDRFKPCAAFLCRLNGFVLFGHYIWLSYINDFSSLYINGVYIPLVALMVFFDNSRWLVIYCAFVILISLVIFLSPTPESTSFFFVLGVATVAIISGATTFLKLRAEVNVRNANEERLSALEQAHRAIAAREKQENLVRLVGGIAHEINTPLAVLVSSNHIMNKMSIADANIKQFILTSERAVAKIARIVSDLHTIVFEPYSRRTESWSVANLVNVTLTILYKAYPNRIVEFKLIDEDMEKPVKVDPITTPNALLALLENGMFSAQQAEGEKWVKIYFDYFSNTLFVENTGAAIEPYIAKVMFEPFFTSREPGQGVGLGLSVARSAIEAHGGQLTYIPNQSHTVFAIQFDSSETHSD